MDYPLFLSTGLGNGMTIALDAVFHVLMSHSLPIGVVFLIAVSESLAARRRSVDWENFGKDMLKPVTVIITSVGAVTGVGIWFTIDSLAPAGAASMMRVFFWPWFVEWIVFTLEVLVLLIYYYAWHYSGRITHPEAMRRHSLLGYGYVGLGWISAALITGILGFMLTSDGWPQHETFTRAFFNPTFWPQLIFRLALAYGMGAILATGFLLLTRRTAAFRAEALPVLGLTGILSFTVMFGVLPWYYFQVPEALRIHARFAVLTSYLSQSPWIFWVVNGAGIAFLYGFAATSLARRAAVTRLLFFPAVLFIVLAFIQFERIREFVRGPYLMPGYMYSNQLLLKEVDQFNREGNLAHSYWFNAVEHPDPTVDQGAFLFARNCTVCHTIGGINDIRDRFRGRPRDAVGVILDHTHVMVPFMAPFAGTRSERDVMTDFLYRTSRGELGIRDPSRLLRLEARAPGGKR